MSPRVVLHAPTPASLGRARSNARNLIAAEPAAQVEIVVNAGAAAAALTSADAATDRFVLVCENSLKSSGLDGSGYRTIPAAIVHLARRQADGWAYIRA